MDDNDFDQTQAIFLDDYNQETDEDTDKANTPVCLVFYLKKNRMARRHAPFDKKKRGAMYCRCALFHFFKRSVICNLNFQKIVKKCL
jgi:hypothetical protein